MNDRQLLKCILDAEKKNKQWLNLSQKRLVRLPDEISRLSQIRKLYLSTNKLEELNPALFHLSDLDILDIINNKLHKVPPEIRGLHKLCKLYLSHNRIEELCPEIGCLTELESLALDHNKISRLPSEIGRLSQLTELNLERNRLSFLPPEIGQLTNLTSLKLCGNNLTSLPLEIKNLTRLRHLDLGENRLAAPPEILARVDEPAAIVDYYLQHLHSSKKKPLREAKLHIVGQVNVGKTQITRRLRGKRFQESERKTHGINIYPWRLKHGDKQIKVNIWDFGGQEILHATHRFFLTKRSLYLLVWDTREEDRYGLVDYWMKLIRSYGDDAPVIIALNKIDIGDLGLVRRELLDKYPNIVGFVRVSCKTGENMDQLIEMIAREMSQLPRIEDQLLDSWFEIKETLGRMTVDYITYQEYKELCEKKGLNRQNQETLIGFLHDLGVVLNFSNISNNASNKELRDIHILNPKWVTNGVYQILNHASLANNGILTLEQLEDILDRNIYPIDKQRLITDMMARFELCFPLSDRADRFLIPELLPYQPPKFQWDNENSIAFQFHYNFFPTYIMSRFIVRMHRYISGKLCWRSGVVLTHGQVRALIRSDRDGRRVYIQVKGDADRRKDFLVEIARQFDKIHSMISKVKARPVIPIYKNQNILIDYNYLIGLERQGERFFYAPETMERFEIRQFLDTIGRWKI